MIGEARSGKVPAVGFDLDDVILDHRENKAAVAKLFGFSLRIKEMPSDIARLKMPPSVYEYFQNLLYYHPAYAFSPPLFAGSLVELSRLKKSGIPYFLISRRKNPSVAIEIMKLKGLWPGVFREENSFFVRSKADKDSKAAELGLSVYIDDQPSVLECLKTVKRKFLFDPCEAYKELVGDYGKVCSWQEISRELKRLS